MEKQPHILAIPFPAQGHIKPLMELSYRLVDSGVKVTFLNTELNHEKIVETLPENSKNHNPLRLISISDGKEGSERSHFPSFTEDMLMVMRGQIENLIKKCNESDDNGDEKITCVIVDVTFGWVFDFAEKFGVKLAAFWPGSVDVLTGCFQIPKLIDAGIIDEDGFITQIEMKGSSPSSPISCTTKFLWNSTDNPILRKSLYRVSKRILQGAKPAKWIFSNSIYELESSSCDSTPCVLPVGPLLSNNRLEVGQLWKEDSTCLNWLDEQPHQSVIYISFGSLTIFNQQQFEEVELALELLDRPFLLAIRPGLVQGAMKDCSKVKASPRGKIVSWTPQQKVMAHPSIACYITHCGWGSVMEGLNSGVPFLCWPYVGDHFMGQSYICDVWKVGLSLNPNENGIISRDEIKTKVEELISDESIRVKVLELQKVVASSTIEGGSSRKNFQVFLEELKK